MPETTTPKTRENLSHILRTHKFHQATTDYAVFFTYSRRALERARAHDTYQPFII